MKALKITVAVYAAIGLVLVVMMMMGGSIGMHGLDLLATYLILTGWIGSCLAVLLPFVLIWWALGLLEGGGRNRYY